MTYADLNIQIPFGKSSGEIWKNIDGYDDIFKVSNYGRVFHTSYFVNSRYGKTRIVSDGYIKPIIGKRGYYVVHIHYKGFRKALYIHRLLAEYFIPKIEGKNFVNHKNCIKIDNSLSNLEWCTQKENDTHARLNGLNKEKGETHHAAKFTNKDIVFIREQYDNKNIYTVRRLADYFNCSVSTIYRIGKRKQWVA